MDYRRIIPCLDVKDGRLVKGVNFVELKDVGDPAENAAAYSDAGADELVFLDITATVEKRKTLLDAVKRTVEKTSVPLTVGGGISSCEAIKELLSIGASKISINTAAVYDPDFVKEAAKEFGSDKITIAIDTRTSSELPSGFEVMVKGGRAIADAVALPVIASGGAGTLEHLYQAIVDGGADAVLVASIAHFGKFTIRQMKEYLAQRQIPVNL